MRLCQFVEGVAVLFLANQCVRTDGKLVDPSLFGKMLSDVANNALGVDKVQVWRLSYIQ